MISTSERDKWLRILEKHRIVNLMRQKSKREDFLLNSLASVAAWTAPLLDRVSDFFPLYTPHNYSLHVSTALDTLDWIMSENLKNKIEIHELFCLLAACLTHDVGMAVSQKEVQKMSSDVHFQDYKASVEDEMQKQIDENNLKRLWMIDNKTPDTSGRPTYEQNSLDPQETTPASTEQKIQDKTDNVSSSSS